MKIGALKKENLEDFISYCKKHRSEIDESFLSEEDLKDFQSNDENPTYIVTDPAGKIKAAASLIINDYYRSGKKGRFRIFHSEIDNIVIYNMLFKAVLQHTEELEQVFLFIPLVNKSLIQFMEQLNFTAERHAFLLVRDELQLPEIKLPENYTIRAFQPEIDELVWCQIRNAAFANLQGSETPITPEMVTKMVASKDYIEDGMMILSHLDQPVGVVRGSDEEYEGEPIMNIGPLAILPEYQGKGLGRVLLRAALYFAKEKNYRRTILSVNGENEKAIAIYIQEGFKQAEAVTCYKYTLK